MCPVFLFFNITALLLEYIYRNRGQHCEMGVVWLNFDMNNVLLFLLNIFIGLTFLVLAAVYFFTEAMRPTRPQGMRALLLSGMILAATVTVLALIRFVVVFPPSAEIDMSSDFNFYLGIIQAAAVFFTTLLYLRCGTYFARLRDLPGSRWMDGMPLWRKIDWKMVLLPLPFLMIWTLAWFSVMEPEPTELALAMTPESEDLPTLIYLLLSIVVLAPIQEEILYRHFAMGLFYRWFGRSRGVVLTAILVSTVIFSVAHVAILTDNWIKFVQILPAGLSFGFIYYKRGLEHSILAHALFNGLIGPAYYLLEFLS